MAKKSVCPQRILKEAVRLLSRIETTEETAEEIDNNILELEALASTLYRMGITAVEDGTS